MIKFKCMLQNNIHIHFISVLKIKIEIYSVILLTQCYTVRFYLTNNKSNFKLLI